MFTQLTRSETPRQLSRGGIIKCLNISEDWRKKSRSLGSFSYSLVFVCKKSRTKKSRAGVHLNESKLICIFGVIFEDFENNVSMCRIIY
jgi:hypothetical protein